MPHDARWWYTFGSATLVAFIVQVVTGITLGAVGCFSDRDGMCTAGQITGLAGAVVTAGAIWLIRRSLPRVRIDPLASGAVGLYGDRNGAGVVARF